MKSRWFSHVYLHLLAIGFFLIPAAWVQAQSVEQILKQKPSQSDVTIDIPAPEDVAKCKIGAFAEGGYDGKVLYGPDGSTPLRVICRQTGSKDKNNNRVEEIRFFHNGVEVFRENLITGESRWLGDAGSRIGQRRKKRSRTQIKRNFQYNNIMRNPRSRARLPGILGYVAALSLPWKNN